MSDRDLFARSAERARSLAATTTDVSLRKLLDEMSAVFEARVADHGTPGSDNPDAASDPTAFVDARD